MELTAAVLVLVLVAGVLTFLSVLAGKVITDAGRARYGNEWTAARVVLVTWTALLALAITYGMVRGLHWSMPRMMLEFAGVLLGVGLLHGCSYFVVAVLPDDEAA